jgi:hypothetical protein
MPKGRYYGLIKEYDGGTPMECWIHPSIDFTRIDDMLAAQRSAIRRHVRERSKSAGTIYPPLHLQQQAGNSSCSNAPLTDADGQSTLETPEAGAGPSASNDATISTAGASVATPVDPGISSSAVVGTTVTRGSNPLAVRIMSIPGIVEAGWTLPDIVAALGGGAGGSGSSTGTLTGASYDGGMIGGGAGAGSGRAGSVRGGAGIGGAAGTLRADLLGVVRKLQEQHFSWPFREPVDTAYVSVLVLDDLFHAASPHSCNTVLFSSLVIGS